MDTFRVGIFGGSFDPVHLGHICLAEDAIKIAELDQLVFMPAGIQPFKQDRQMASGRQRVDMLRLATNGNSRIMISDYELNKEGMSYTYLTMRYMKKHYCHIASETGKRLELFFICGTDSFLSLEKWMNSSELLSNYSYVIGSRPGYREDELKNTMDHLRTTYGTSSLNIHNRLRDISSTEIRERAAAGAGLQGLVPEEVEKYINDNKLYR